MATEFSIRENEALLNGLRRYKKGSRNSNFLIRCHNIKPFERSAKSVEEIIQTFTGIEVNWPHPQVFRGRTYDLLASEDYIHSIPADAWTSPTLDLHSPITEPGTLMGPIYDVKTKGIGSITTGGGAWHFADFGPMWMMFNELNVLFKADNLSDVYYNPDFRDFRDQSLRLFIAHTPATTTGCGFRGQLITAGFTNNEQNLYWHSLAENEVAWSQIGGGDLLFPYIPKLRDTGFLEGVGDGAFPGKPAVAAFTVRPYNRNKSIALDYFKKNEAGHMPMPFPGAIRKVKALNNAVIVYGDNGIAAIVPGGDMFPTFGLQELPKVGRVGVHSRTAVGGDLNRHVFIDRAGFVWTIDGELQPERLGYQEFFELETDVIVTYDTEEDDFYLSSQENAYLLNFKGLCSISQHPTTLARVNGRLTGFFKETGNDAVEITTESRDFGTRSIKKIVSVEVGMATDGEVNVATEYRFDKFSPFIRSDWRETDSRGISVQQIAGVDLRFVIKASIFTRVEDIDFIEIRYTIPDKRNIRGRRANQTDGGTSEQQLG